MELFDNLKLIILLKRMTYSLFFFYKNIKTYPFYATWYRNSEIVKAYKNFLSKNKNISSKRKVLIQNLDKTSVKTVDTILARIKKVLNSKAEKINCFTIKEKEQLGRLKLDFKNQIKKLDDNCYSYKEFLIPINHFESSVFYYEHQIHDIDNLDYIKDKNILDVGGFIGDSAIVLSKYTDAEVHTFEPEKENYDLILKTIKMNNKSNIIPHKIGLGNKKEILKLAVNNSASTLIDTYLDTDNYEEINLTTLDEFIKDNPMNIGLIKVDVEGFEQQFLHGAKETIKSQKPILLISIYHSLEDFFDIKPMIESWDLGYNFKIRKPIDGNISFETLLICEPY